MAQHMAAPWAQVVPNRGNMTADDLLVLPEDAEWQYELVEGRLVRMPPPGGEHGRLAFRLGAVLYAHVAPAQLGDMLAAETGFQLNLSTVLAGDVAFVRSDRVPAQSSDEWKKYWRLAPDLVAEVASPSQKRDELEAKARVWLGAGVRLVWLVWPDVRQVDVWHADASGAPQMVATLKAGDALDGLDVLPGFSYPLADLFA